MELTKIIEGISGTRRQENGDEVFSSPFLRCETEKRHPYPRVIEPAKIMLDISETRH
jgi:hypothetical protein